MNTYKLLFSKFIIRLIAAVLAVAMIPGSVLFSAIAMSDEFSGVTGDYEVNGGSEYQSYSEPGGLGDGASENNGTLGDNAEPGGLSVIISFDWDVRWNSYQFPLGRFLLG